MNTRQQRINQKSRNLGNPHRANRHNPTNLVSAFAPERLTPQPEPPIVSNTIKLTKRIQLFIPPDSTPTITPITPSILMSTVPGGLTFWNRVRVERIDVWGSGIDDSTLQVEIVPDVAWNQPSLQLEDVGTPGQRRPAIGVRLGLLDRGRWFGTADTTVIAQVSTSSLTSNIIVQATIELTSPPLV